MILSYPLEASGVKTRKIASSSFIQTQRFHMV
jgi:hypothetical protein